MPRARTGPQTADQELAELLRAYSIEVTTHSRSAVEVCRDHLAPGTEVYIAFVPGETHHAVVATAAKLRTAGFVPVPHVTARSVASFTQLGDFLARLAGEAGVTRALVVAGDLERAAGPYHSSLELLQTGLFPQHGIRRIGLACYPEEHRRIDAGLLEQALLAKLELVRGAGLEAWLVTQFCFEAAPILQRVRQLRDLGIAAPLRVGLAGPADRRTLWKYALHCGIGNSIRALGTRVDAVVNLLARRAPDGIMRELAAAQRGDPGLGIEGVHIFTFGGVASAAAWANAILAAAPPPAR
jgi:methylenetetrahydrofolate reductase (NADPH)